MQSSSQTPRPLIIDDRKLGAGHPPYMVAELSANHLGDLERALAIMDAAAAAGVDAIKLQTYTADTITIDCDRPEFQIRGGLWDGLSLHQLYDQAHTPWEWHKTLFHHGRSLGITVFSSPFDATAIDLLEKLECPAYKIASFELVDHDLIARAAATGKPVIMSSGMASPDEIDQAVAVARAAGDGGIAVLHCLSGYPTPPNEFNLRRMNEIGAQVGSVVGISDHTLGNVVAIAGVALGACIVEKHITLARRDGGPDAAFSLEPHEFRELVDSCHTAWTALGNGCSERAASEAASKQYRRSLYAVKDIAKGEPFTRDNVRSIRPNAGLAPRFLPRVLGRAAACEVPKGTPLDWQLVAKG